MTTQGERQGRARGFVLACRDFGESDRIVSFYTEEKGKLKGIAKGARKSKRRFVNAIEPFCLSRILFSRRRSEGLFLIEECDVINHYPSVRADLEKSLAASYFIELVDLFTEEGKAGRRLFEHLTAFLDLLEEGSLSESLVRIFEIRLLSVSGYAPALDRCVRCGVAADEANDVRFLLEDGGIRCSRCRGAADHGISLSPGTVRTLAAGRRMPADKLRRLAFTARALRESEDVMSRLIRHILGREPRSLRVYREVAQLGKKDGRNAADPVVIP